MTALAGKVALITGASQGVGAACAERMAGQGASLNPPSGCAFHGRCPHATDLCGQERSELRDLGGHAVACHHAETIGG